MVASIPVNKQVSVDLKKGDGDFIFSIILIYRMNQFDFLRGIPASA